MIDNVISYAILKYYLSGSLGTVKGDGAMTSASGKSLFFFL